MLYKTRLPQWSIGSLLTGALVLGIEARGCRYGAGPLPLGIENNTRTASTLASDGRARPMELPGLPNLHKVLD